jgi:hypothetical protein
MSEMMNGFVMHGIGKVGMIQKPIPRLAGSYPPRSPNWICPGHTSHLYPSHSKIWSFSLRFEAEPNGDS